MRQLTKHEYDIRVQKLQNKITQRQMKKELRQLRWSWLPKIKKPNFSKFMVLLMTALCFYIIWRSMNMMEQTNDLSAMYVVIGVPVALLPTCVGFYMKKSMKENTEGGITYDMAINNPILDDSDEGQG